MPQTGCEDCKTFLDRAAEAISAHAHAVGNLSEAVSAGSEVDWTPLEEAVRAARFARKLAVEQYETHRFAPPDLRGNSRLSNTKPTGSRTS
jgi:hypothetical protein